MRPTPADGYISAPRYFEVERQLRETLEIPVFHDDQHGTAVVVLAAAINALRVVGKSLEHARVVVSGAGAAGTACATMLVAAGVNNLIGCDIHGVIHQERTEPGMQWWAIIPSVFNRRVTTAVAAAVEEAAYDTGVARRERNRANG